MSSELIPIYAGGIALIALMVAFSSHNRKTGWKKTRPTMLEALNDLYADLGVGIESSTSSLPASVAPAAPPDSDFSLQLLKLRGALGNSNSSGLNQSLGNLHAAVESKQAESKQIVMTGPRR
jgi:hypothetical protein